MLIDISHRLGDDDLAYPGDEQFRHESLASVEPDGYALSRFSGTVHCGTHLDAPAHFHPSGATIDQLPLERFDLPCVVVDCSAAEMVGEAALDGLEQQAGGAVLFRTRNGQLPRDRYVPDHCALTLAAAQRLLELQVSLVGIDYISIERGDNPDYPVHRLLLGAGVLLLEDVDLREVVPGRYRLRCYPLRITGAEGAPCRAVLESL